MFGVTHMISGTPYSQWNMEIGTSWYGATSLQTVLRYYTSLIEKRIKQCTGRKEKRNMGRRWMFHQDNNLKYTGKITHESLAWLSLESPGLKLIEIVSPSKGLLITLGNWKPNAKKNGPKLNPSLAKSYLLLMSQSSNCQQRLCYKYLSLVICLVWIFIKTYVCNAYEWILFIFTSQNHICECEVDISFGSIVNNKNEKLSDYLFYLTVYDQPKTLERGLDVSYSLKCSAIFSHHYVQVYGNYIKGHLFLRATPK